MENPYKAPAESSSVSPQTIENRSLGKAAAAGIKFAVRWVTRIVLPILVLVFVCLQLILIYRGVTLGMWPAYAAPQFWYTMVALVLALTGAYIVACFGLDFSLRLSIRFGTYLNHAINEN